METLKAQKHKNPRFLAPETQENQRFSGPKKPQKSEISDGCQKSKRFSKSKKISADSKESLKESENFQEPNNFDDTQIEVSDRCQYLYTYGIISLKDLKPQKHKNDGDFLEFNFNGLREKPITIITYEDIGVLVSKYPFLNPILTEKEAMEHADILKKIAKKTTIIPMAFGNVFNDKKILESVLKKSYNAIKEGLEKINNKMEFGVKVIKNNVEEKGIENKGDIIVEILNPLNKLSAKSMQGENFSERLLLNHSFLVEKNNFSKFSNAIANLEKKYKQFKFNYTGPWPPYSFVNIHIGEQK